jgi:hypothetical protein
LIILNKQLRKNKNKIFLAEHNNLNGNFAGGRKMLTIVEEESEEGLWKKDINLIV